MILSALAFALAHVQTPLAELDFELYNNQIYMPVSVNGHKATAVLDTGAGSAVMSLDLADEWKLAETGQIPVGGIGKDQVTGKLLTDATIDIGGIKTPVRIAIPLGTITKMSGRPLEVIIGYEFLKDHIVEVDYPKHHLRVFDAHADLPVDGESIPTHIVANHVHLAAGLTVDGQSYSVGTVIDTGASGGGGLSSKFLKQHPLTVPMTPDAVIGGGVGGELRGSYFRPDLLKIGGVSFARPVMTLTSSAGGASGPASNYDLLLGGEVLRRFRITVDYPHSRMIFAPGGDIARPFEADKTGLRFFAEGPSLSDFRIASVLPGSSSAAAGLKAGDLIENVDGKLASSFGFQVLREEFRSATAKGWDLGIVRDGQHLKVRVEAKSIV